MKKNLVQKTAVAAFASVLLLSGCSSNPSPIPPPEPTQVTTSPTKAPSDPTKAPTKATISPTKAPTAAPKPSSGTALAVLETLKVSDVHETGYKRNLFGASWIDMNNNGCDTREDTLAHDMTDVQKSGNCEVKSGFLNDPYTLVPFQFVSDGKGGNIDIDHVVALSAGWKTGMANAPEKIRYSFANDPLNLLAVDAGLNRYKGDKDASEWTPSQGKSKIVKLDSAKDCPYVARQIAVKSKYKLWVTTSEKSAMLNVLNTCKGEKVPTGGLKVVVKDSMSPSPDAKKPVAKPVKPKADAPKPTQPKADAPKPKASANAKNDPDMGTCGAATAAGYGPYHKGDVEYSYYQDRDGDGTVCE